MSDSKEILFEDLAGQIAMLNDEDRAEFAQFLVKNYSYTATELSRDIGFAEMDQDYAPFETFDVFQSREGLLT